MIGNDVSMRLSAQHGGLCSQVLAQLLLHLFTCDRCHTFLVVGVGIGSVGASQFGQSEAVCNLDN